MQYSYLGGSQYFLNSKYKLVEVLQGQAKKNKSIVLLLLVLTEFTARFTPEDHGHILIRVRDLSC